MRKPFLPAILVLFAGLLCSQCAHLVQTREDYVLTSSEPRIQGARLTAELIPTEGVVDYSFAAMVYVRAGERETGPYKGLLTAWGDRQTHRWMSVDSLAVQQQDGPSTSLPPAERIPFAPGTDDQGWQATYVLPGVFPFDYTGKRPVTLQAQVTIGGLKGRERRAVTLEFSPTPARDVRFLTLLDQDDSPSTDDLD